MLWPLVAVTFAALPHTALTVASHHHHKLPQPNLFRNSYLWALLAAIISAPAALAALYARCFVWTGSSASVHGHRSGDVTCKTSTAQTLNSQQPDDTTAQAGNHPNAAAPSEQMQHDENQQQDVRSSWSAPFHTCVTRCDVVHSFL